MALTQLFNVLLCLVIGVAASSKSYVVNLAAAYDTSVPDGWSRYIYWQNPNGTIVLQKRGETDTIIIPQAITPQKATPLSAFSRGLTPGYTQVVMCYLDENGYIVNVSCRNKGDTYDNWATEQSSYKSDSGLAMVEINGTIRKFYINDDNYVVQELNDVVTQLGPKAIKGSQLSASVPSGSTDLHVFYLTEDKTLSSMSLSGSSWSAVLPNITNFSANAKTGFSVASWSDPSVFRVFFINDAGVTNEWTLNGNDSSVSWTNTTSILGTKPAAFPSEPVVVSRSENGTGRYLEYFYTAPGGHINYISKNFVDGPPFMIQYATFDVPVSDSGYTKDQKIALGTGLGIGIPGFIAAVVGIYISLRSSRPKSEKSPGSFLPWKKNTKGQETTTASDIS